MTSFTRIPEGETPCISVNPLNSISNIDKNTYAGFTEHMGRCIYGGLYDPSSKFADENGFRTDVIDAMRELRVPTVRYPGGNFTATYHWMDGIGPREKRPKRPELAWLGTESNAFGTDEFMKWCKLVDCEPYLCFNMGTGTLDEALGWLEYCNGTQDTYYANLRRQNGHPEPYNVKYWAIGNEVWGPWQVEETTKEAYAHKAYQWAKALKLFDSSIQLVLCGCTGFSTWDSYVVSKCIKWSPHGLGGDVDKQLFDMHSIHIYTASDNHVQNSFSPLAAELAIKTTSAMIDLARIENKVPANVPKPKICFDEWNVWDSTRAPGDKGAEERYTLSDAIATSIYLSAFIRQSAHLGMANIAQSVNVLAPLLTSPTDPNAALIRQTTFYPLLLFSKFMRGKTLAVNVRCEEYTGTMALAKDPGGGDYSWMRGAIATPWLDVSATVCSGTEEVAEPEAHERAERNGKYVCMAVTNVHEEKDFETRLEVGGDGKGLVGKKVKVYTVTGKNPRANNYEGEEQVKIEESAWDGEETFKFPRCSLTLLRWKI